MAFFGPESHSTFGLGSYLDASKTTGGGSLNGGNTLSPVSRACQQGSSSFTTGSHGGTWRIMGHSIENNGRHTICVRIA
jgi:hypothetical protein